MKSFEDLAMRFESIAEPAIPEEILGAYMEGNLSDQDAEYVSDAIYKDADLYQLMEGVMVDDAYDMTQDDADAVEVDFVEYAEVYGADTDADADADVEADDIVEDSLRTDDYYDDMLSMGMDIDNNIITDTDMDIMDL